jgi:HlyD family secretion protein
MHVMTTKRIVALAVGLVVVVALLAVGWMAFVRPVGVEVAGPARDVAVQVFGLGTVEARTTSKVGFKVACVLTDLRADVGDHFVKGAVLARLNDREQRARVARAAAAVHQAEANLQKATASLEKAKVNAANAARVSEHEGRAHAGGGITRLSRG